MDIKDITGLSKPATKLIEVLSAGMGKLYEPKAIRKKAEAEAFALKTLSVAKGEAFVIETEAQALAQIRLLEVLAKGDPEIVTRARLRILSREIEGQANVETIAEHALNQLPSVVSDQPVADDWRRKFFLEAENICDADLQLLWGKVLAGETASPGSYSVRTLGILKNLSRAEAETFRLFCSLVFNSGFVINPGIEKLKEFDITYASLLILRDAGLLHENDNLQRRFNEIPDSITSFREINNGVLIELSSPMLRHLRIPVYPLTQSGNELRNLIPPTPCEPYLKVLANFLREQGFSVKRGVESAVATYPGAILTSFDEDL